MNISEFSKVAGVSVSAVSRYFNDGYLSDDKRELIEKAIAETGYEPSRSAAASQKKVTKVVGVIIPKLSSESCARVVEGIIEVLDDEGYELLLVNTHNDYNKELSSLELFKKKRTDGVILLATVFTDRHRELFGKMHIPTVIVGQRFDGMNCICHNDEGAAYTLTKLMLERGSVRPAFIGANPDDPAAGAARRAGFERALSEAGINLRKGFAETAKFDIDSGYEKAKRIFSGRVRPDSLFCATDNIAGGAMILCRELGIRIPEDLMVSAIGDTKLGRVAYSPLTTARLHYKTAGHEAASMLLTGMKTNSDVHKILQLEYEIIERESTARI